MTGTRRATLRLEMESRASVEEFERERPLLLSIAYRMLGSISEAEDVVQDAFVRYQRLDAATIETPRAYLTTVTTRLAIDELRSARARREHYVGSWLPEPLLADPTPDAFVAAERADSLSMAFLVLLESLNPVERAVFVLHDVFDFAFAEIAGIVERSEANCRQIASRARAAVDARRPRFEPSAERRAELAERFMAACLEGDVDRLVALLAADVVLYGDGGGKAPAVPAPVHGRERVAQILLAFTRQAERMGARPVALFVNGQPGALVRDRDGNIVSVLALDVGAGDVGVLAVRSVVNPEKLGHLGNVADLVALLRGRRS